MDFVTANLAFDHAKGLWRGLDSAYRGLGFFAKIDAETFVLRMILARR
jgi:hypothetical protein